MKTREVTCKRCGRVWIEEVRGPRRKYCLETCSDPKNTARDLRRLAESDPDRAMELAGQRALPSGVQEAALPLRLALALSTRRLDDATALAAAGIDPSDPGASELIERAKRMYPEIVAGNPAALANVHAAAYQQAIATVLFRAHEMSGPQAAAAAKSVSQAEVTGTGKLHTRIVLSFDE